MITRNSWFVYTPSLPKRCVFYNGKSFALRGVKEQVDLCFGQLV